MFFLDSCIQFYFGKNIIGYVYNKPRLSSFFGDELILGSFFFKLLPIFIFINYILQIKKFKFLNELFLFFIIIMIIFSGDRAAAFLSILFLTSILLFTNIFGNSVRNKILLFFSILTLISSTVFLSSNLHSRYIQTTINDFNFSISNFSGIRLFSHEHESIYHTSIKMFNDKPLFGHGPKTFRLKCKDPKFHNIGGCNTHPHNFYLQLLSETGLIGFSFLMFLYLFVLLKTFKNYYRYMFTKKNLNFVENAETLFFTFFLLYFFPIIPTGNVFSNYNNSIIFLILGFYFSKEILINHYYNKKNN